MDFPEHWSPTKPLSCHQSIWRSLNILHPNLVSHHISQINVNLFPFLPSFFPPVLSSVDEAPVTWKWGRDFTFGKQDGRRGCGPTCVTLRVKLNTIVTKHGSLPGISGSNPLQRDVENSVVTEKLQHMKCCSTHSTSRMAHWDKTEMEHRQSNEMQTSKTGDVSVSPVELDRRQTDV